MSTSSPLTDMGSSATHQFSLSHNSQSLTSVTMPSGMERKQSASFLVDPRRQSISESSVRLDMVVTSEGGRKAEIKCAGFLDRLAPPYAVPDWASTRGSTLRVAGRAVAARDSLIRMASGPTFDGALRRGTRESRDSELPYDSHPGEGRSDAFGESSITAKGFTPSPTTHPKAKSKIRLAAEQQQPQGFTEGVLDSPSPSSSASEKEDSPRRRTASRGSANFRHSFRKDPGESVSVRSLLEMKEDEEEEHDNTVLSDEECDEHSDLYSRRKKIPPFYREQQQCLNDLFFQIERSIRAVGHQDGASLLRREQRRRQQEAEFLRDSDRFILTSKKPSFFTHVPESATDAEGVLSKRKQWHLGKKRQLQIQEVLCNLVRDEITPVVDQQTADEYLERRAKKYDGSVTTAIGPATEVLQSYWRIYGINVQHQVDFVDKVIRRHSIDTYRTIVKEINRFSNRSDAFSNVMRLVALRETLVTALLEAASSPLLVQDKHELERKRAEEAAMKEANKAKGDMLNYRANGDEWDRERERRHEKRRLKQASDQHRESSSITVRRGEGDGVEDAQSGSLVDISYISRDEDGVTPGGEVSVATIGGDDSLLRTVVPTTGHGAFSSSLLKSNASAEILLRPRFKPVSLVKRAIANVMPMGYVQNTSSNNNNNESTSGGVTGGGGGVGQQGGGGGGGLSSTSLPTQLSISTALGKSKIVTAQIPLESVPGTSQHAQATLNASKSGGGGGLSERTSVTHATHENMLLEIMILITHLRHVTVTIVDIITHERQCCREVANRAALQIAQVGAGVPQPAEHRDGEDDDTEAKKFDVDSAPLATLRRRRHEREAKLRRKLATTGDPLEKLIHSMGASDDIHLASKLAPSVSAKRLHRKPRRQHQAGDVPLPLMWDGKDYLYKMRSDLAPLDETGLGELLAMAASQYDAKKQHHVESVADEAGFYCPRFRFNNNPFLLADTAFSRSKDANLKAQASEPNPQSTAEGQSSESPINKKIETTTSSQYYVGATPLKKGLEVGNPPPPVDSVLLGYRADPKLDPVVAANNASIASTMCVYVEDAGQLVEARQRRKALESIRAKRRLIADRKRQIERSQMAEIRGVHNLTAISTTDAINRPTSPPSRTGTRHATVVIHGSDREDHNTETRLRDLHASALSIVAEVNAGSRHVPFRTYFNRHVLPDKKERSRREKVAEEEAIREEARRRLESQGRLANVRDGMSVIEGGVGGSNIASGGGRRHHLVPLSPARAPSARSTVRDDGSPHLSHLNHKLDGSIRTKEDLTEGLFDAYGRHVNRYRYPSHIYEQEEPPFWEKTTLVFARSLDAAFMERRHLLRSMLTQRLGAEAGRVQRAATRNQGLSSSSLSSSALGAPNTAAMRDANYKFRIDSMVRDSLMQRTHTSFPPDVRAMEDPESAVEQVVVDAVSKTFVLTWGTRPYSESELLERHKVIFSFTMYDDEGTATETKLKAVDGQNDTEKPPPTPAYLSARKKFARAMNKIRFAIDSIKYQRSLPTTQRQLRAAQELIRWMEVAGAQQFARALKHQLADPLLVSETRRLEREKRKKNPQCGQVSVVNASRGTVTFVEEDKVVDEEASDADDGGAEATDATSETENMDPYDDDDPHILSHPEDDSFRFKSTIANEF